IGIYGSCRNERNVLGESRRHLRYGYQSWGTIARHRYSIRSSIPDLPLTSAYRAFTSDGVRSPMKLPQVLVTAFVVSLLAPVAMAQRADRHMLADDAQSLYRRSPFAHGYIHGYEEGFHCANL